VSTVAQSALNGADTDGAAAVARAETPRIGIWEAMGRHRRLTVLPILILLAITVALGLGRSPRYSAETRLIVGRLAITNPGLSGYVTATQSLAAAYSRAVTASEVTEPVARELNMSVGEVTSRLAASPIQQSPVFRVIATGRSRAQAIALANDTSRSLIGYVAKLNRENPDGPRLLAQYGRATRAFDRASLEQQTAHARFNRRPNRANEATFSAASSARAAAELQTTTLGALYESSESGQAISSLVGTLNTATTASSDRNSVLELLAFLAVAVGLAIGAALATARANRSRREPRPTAA
jgi:hypothetical protein